MKARTVIGNYPVTDSDIYPVPAGTGLIQGGSLTLRVSGEELIVKAPAKFLQALFRWCDGTRSLQELELMANAKWPGSRFADFMRAMLESGVLVDASDLAQQMFQDDRLARPYIGRANAEHLVQAFTSPAGTNAGALRSLHTLSDVPLKGMLSGLFHGQGIAEKKVFSALSTRGLDLLVYCREAVGDISAGVHEVFMESGTASIRSLENDSGHVAYRAFPDLYYFFRSQVTIAIFARGDSAYPLDVGLTAAGAAMQRLSDLAQSLGMDLVEADAAYADAFSALCGRDRQWFLGGAFLSGVGEALRGGSTLGADQVARLPVSLKIAKYGEEDGVYLAAAQLAHANGTVRTGWGRSGHARLACAKALSEVVERYAYCEPPQGLVFEKGSNLPPRLHPKEFVQFSATQYQDKAASHILPYVDDAARFWVNARYLDNGDTVMVPADCVFYAPYLPGATERGMLMRQTSSGCASDISIDVAIERAGLELIERDAFIRHWLAQRPGQVLVPESLPQGLQDRISSWHQKGCTLRFGLFAGSWGPVIFAVIDSTTHQFSAIAASCAGPLAASLEHALGEVEIAGFSGLRFRPEKRIKPQAVNTPADHGMLFRQKEYFQRTSAITESGTQVRFDDVAKTWPDGLGARLTMATSPSRALWVDLTYVAAPMSLDGQVIRTARVLIPGAIPMAFGFDGLPLGMGADVSLRGKFPHPFN